ncbi:MAG: ATP-binding protein, partial [Acidimicrobiia bacterium]|nr:ATP-binding protein [Acidimicrobiia bacterium]
FESLDSLIDGYRDLGMDIRANIEAEPAGIPQAVEQSAYRIIEEALTNAIKHAGPTQVEVSLAYGNGDVHVRVRDHGGTLATRPLGREPHEGRGLVGIKERAALLGGDVVATPHPEGGFIVVANLPYDRNEES